MSCLFVVVKVVILSTLIYNTCAFGFSNYPKCCPKENFLKKINESNIFECSPSNSSQIQILNPQFNNSDDSPSSGSDHQCIDVTSEKIQEINVFVKVQTDRFASIAAKKARSFEESMDFFRKCCPVDYLYNSTSHGCIKPAAGDEVQKFFSQNLVKVGLPHCRIIVDVRLYSSYSYLLSDDVDVQISKEDFLKEFRKTKGFDKRSFDDKDTYCVDLDQSNIFIARLCQNDYEICKSRKCVRKCCPDGQSFINGSFCKETYVHGLDLSGFPTGKVENANDANFAIVHGFNPPIYSISSRFRFKLDHTGVFVMVEKEPEGNTNITRSYGVEEAVYCVEYAYKENKTKSVLINDFSFFRQFSPNQISDKFIYTRWAMAVSCFFFFLTILYYCLSKEKRTVFGKTLICYCLISLAAFLLLSYLAFDVRPGRHSCIILAFFVLYATLSSFTWMNIMCVDIYWTFGSSKSFSSFQHRGKELKRFLLYSLYGWGFPLLLTVVPVIFYHVDVLPGPLRVIINEKKCFVNRGEGNYAQFLFSTIILAILELCNLVLFIKTAMYCMEVKREITKMNDTHALKGEKKQRFNKFKDRFGLLIKLFLIMGISFLFEVVSTFYDFKKNSTTSLIETIWDTINSLQGFFIFVIFVGKRRILNECLKKLSIGPRLRKFSLTSSAITNIVSLQSPGNNKN